MKALLSVSDKEGIVEFAKALESLGIGILSTGGTRRKLEGAGIHVTGVAEYTGSPEILGGRVKTLHPKIHAGLLADLKNPEHVAELKRVGAEPIGILAVNLYPFEKTVSQGHAFSEAIENIDIGGPTMVRAAAKNYESVTVIIDPADYQTVIEELKAGGVSAETKKRLATKVFMNTAYYDALIASYLSDEKFPELLTLPYRKIQNLRYGENPHQEAAFYREPVVGVACLANAKQIHGKELSLNNILDMDSALKLVKEFKEVAAVILKHNNPCGAATATSQLEAYKKAMETDSMSAFGGIVALNTPAELETAKEITSTFIECVVAPGYEPDALEWLTAKKKKLRLIEVPPFRGKEEPADLNMKKVVGGMLLQDSDQGLFAGELKVVTERQPTEREMRALLFALRVCKHVKSNSVVYAKEDRTIGIGAGQMSRVDSSVIGAMKAKNAGLDAHGTVLASDAFFPFRDAIDAAAKEGVTAVIQPGGSIRDQEVIDACNEQGIAMVFSGMRHFNH